MGKKRKYEMGRPASMTKIGGYRVHLVRVRGGNIKRRALRLDTGNFSWGSEAIARKARIIDTVYNASNNELVRTKTLVKNAIISIDAAPFRQWYEAHYATTLGRKKGVKLTEADEALFNKKRSKKTQKKYDDRKKTAKVDPLLEAVPNGSYPGGHLFSSWPSRSRRRIYSRRQRARVLHQEAQGQEGQIDWIGSSLPSFFTIPPRYFPSSGVELPFRVLVA